MKVVYCTICGGKRKDGKHIYRFPSNVHTRKAWLDALRLSHLIERSPRSMFICSEHFDRSMLTDAGRIKASIAMPKLPDNPLKYATYRKLFLTNPKKFRSAFRGIDMTEAPCIKTQDKLVPASFITTVNSASKNDNLNSSKANTTTTIPAIKPPRSNRPISSPAVQQILPPKKDECVLFCELLASKLRILEEKARVAVMNEIEQLIFQSMFQRKLKDASLFTSHRTPNQAPKVRSLLSTHTPIKTTKGQSSVVQRNSVSTAPTPNTTQPISASLSFHGIFNIPKANPAPAQVITATSSSPALVVQNISQTSTQTSSNINPNVMQMSVTPIENTINAATLMPLIQNVAKPSLKSSPSVTNPPVPSLQNFTNSLSQSSPIVVKTSIQSSQNVSKPLLQSSPRIVKIPIQSLQTVVKTPIQSSQNVIKIPIQSMQNVTKASIQSLLNVVKPPMQSSQNVVKIAIQSMQNVTNTPIQSLQNIAKTPIQSSQNIPQPLLQSSPSVVTIPTKSLHNVAQIPIQSLENVTKTPLQSPENVAKTPVTPSTYILQSGVLQIPITSDKKSSIQPIRNSPSPSPISKSFELVPVTSASIRNTINTHPIKYLIRPMLKPGVVQISRRSDLLTKTLPSNLMPKSKYSSLFNAIPSINVKDHILTAQSEVSPAEGNKTPKHIAKVSNAETGIEFSMISTGKSKDSHSNVKDETASMESARFVKGGPASIESAQVSSVKCDDIPMELDEDSSYKFDRQPIEFAEVDEIAFNSIIETDDIQLS